MLKICHFQSFPSPFTSPFTTIKQWLQFFYITFESPNVNEIVSYFGHIYNKILDLIMCKTLNLFFKLKLFLKICGLKNTKLNSGYKYFWFLLA